MASKTASRRHVTAARGQVSAPKVEAARGAKSAAPKPAETARDSLILAAASQPTSHPDSAQTSASMRANLFTVGVAVQVATVQGDGLTADNGLSVAVVDISSVRQGRPAARHCLGTLSSAARATYGLRVAPRGVSDRVDGLLGPANVENISQGASWAYRKVCYADSARNIPAAQWHTSVFAMELLDHAYFAADLAQQAGPGGDVKTTVATLLSNRLKLRREGPTAQGGRYSIDDLINFRVSVASALDPKSLKAWKSWAAKYPKIVVLEVVPPLTVFRALTATTAALPPDNMLRSDDKEVPAASWKRPAAASAAVSKRPARRG